MHPTTNSERYHALDAIRGLALFGILLVNIVWFSIPSARFAELYSGGPHWYNDVINFMRTEVFGGRSATIFAFLFGLGLTMQFVKWKSMSLLFKRNAVLAIFGVLHIVFFLGGDILLDYAVFGFLGMLLLQLDKRISLWLAIVVALYPSVLMTLQHIQIVPDLGYGPGGLKLDVEEMVALFQNGSWYDQAVYRIHQYAGIWRNPWVLNYYFPPVFACFSFALYLGRTNFLLSLKNISVYKKLFWFALVYKLIVTFLNYFPFETAEPVTDSIVFKVLFQWDQYVTSALLFAMVVYSFESKILGWIWRPFQKVGKMSLTTYLLESILSAFAFYSIGFAQYNLLSPLQVQLLALAFFVVIVLFAYSWQSKYKWGPFEWIWRKLSYGNLDPSNKD